MDALFTPVVCSFDPLLDCAEVDQFGFMDLRQAYLTGTVDGSLAPDDFSYNGLDDPDSILPAPRDQFEAIRQAEMSVRYDKRKRSVSSAPAAPSTEGDGASSAGSE